MLSNLIRSGFDKSTLIMIILSIPVILLALTVHESAHGLVAKCMGDPTAYNLGRISLNPKKHLDFIGTLMMLFFGFGWAKPVPINSRNFKNPKWGMALSSIAGPLSNLIFAYIYFFAYALIVNYTSINRLLGLFNAGVSIDFMSRGLLTLFLFCEAGVLLNLSLAVFNLLPIPPLDGSRILFTFLPAKAYFGVMKYERIISLVIIVLLFTGTLTLPLTYIRGAILTLFELSVGWMG